jgi:hypothetical protein
MSDDRPARIETESLPAHVALCGLRYRELSRRLSRVEYLLYGIVMLITLGEGSLAELVRQMMARP